LISGLITTTLIITKNKKNIGISDKHTFR
jgi:hypothetical protein